MDPIAKIPAGCWKARWIFPPSPGGLHRRCPSPVPVAGAHRPGTGRPVTGKSEEGRRQAGRGLEDKEATVADVIGPVTHQRRPGSTVHIAALVINRLSFVSIRHPLSTRFHQLFFLVLSLSLSLSLSSFLHSIIETLFYIHIFKRFSLSVCLHAIRKLTSGVSTGSKNAFNFSRECHDGIGLEYDGNGVDLDGCSPDLGSIWTLLRVLKGNLQGS